MNLESVRLFVLAAERLNISEAGRRLGLAPAVASTRLAKLEKSLGADLLHRSTRKVSLSTEGAEFLPFARELLAQEKAARTALGLETPEASGTLRFTAPSSFTQMYIAPLLKGFMAAHPKIRLDLQLSDNMYGLIDGSFDLALRNAALADSSLKARKLADDIRILCASPAYLERHGVPRDPGELHRHQLIGFRNQTARRLKAADGRTGLFDPQSADCRLVLNDGLSQKIATVEGAGISMNSIWSVHKELEAGALRRVLPDFVLDDQTALWLVYPKSNVLTAKVRVFMDFLLEEVGKPLAREQEFLGNTK
ncbi:LysR family transcriptional regulator [Denitrobaculum tricleocarpae]|uniref:LysR family transcriptional regulator n=1 Tax=Denitrobaculum tricleocarpae TaxID=2591009 RepID=A0A545SXQ9_9PROT|nr:LysR family transcriptional regulator [Denitrobaculum tricleocarpae]TQV69746.1 LysR family transcriptional regulator [Denitrobaculum tricleocarpae]